eukprot:9130999-Alexandrium_andersonii.AAC.1
MMKCHARLGYCFWGVASMVQFWGLRSLHPLCRSPCRHVLGMSRSRSVASNCSLELPRPSGDQHASFT